MNEDALKQLVAALGAKQVERKGKWLTCTCPLAPFTHTGGKDSNPSFGIKIGDESPFNCFACESGSLHKLLSTLDFHLQKVPSMAVFYNMKAAHEILAGADLDFLPLPPYEEAWSPDQVFQEWPEYAMEQFDKISNVPRAVEYLEGRAGGLTIAQAEQAEMRFDHKRRMIVCPYRNVYGKLAGARGRNIDAETPKAYRHFDYTWNGVNNAPLVWYNETVLNLDGPVIVVEGQFDCRHVAKVWPKVVANLTAKPSHAKLKKLSQCDSVIIMCDNDDAGQVAREKYKAYLTAQGVQTGILDFPDHWHDPAEVSLEWLSSALEA